MNDATTQTKDGKTIRLVDRVFGTRTGADGIESTFTGTKYRRDGSGALRNIELKPTSKRARAKAKRAAKRLTR